MTWESREEEGDGETLLRAAVTFFAENHPAEESAFGPHIQGLGHQFTGARREAIKLGGIGIIAQGWVGRAFQKEARLLEVALAVAKVG